MTDSEALIERLRAKYTVTDEFSTIRRPVNPDGFEAADHIEALEAENERLREALELADAALRGANMNMNVVQRKVRAALGDTK